jgi:hypothetical protein
MEVADDLLAVNGVSHRLQELSDSTAERNDRVYLTILPFD